MDQDKEFNDWATQQGLIRNAFGITSEQTGIDIARSAWKARSARIAELEAEVARLKAEREWKPIETAPKGKIVLAHYKNCLGNGRTVRAKYYLHETLESDDAESGYAAEGWYEEAEGYEYLMPLESEPTHWMPLPAKPAEATKGGA